MWGQSVETEHSEAAGRESVLVLVVVAVVIILAAAGFALLIAHGFQNASKAFVAGASRISLAT